MYYTDKWALYQYLLSFRSGLLTVDGLMIQPCSQHYIRAYWPLCSGTGMKAGLEQFYTFEQFVIAGRISALTDLENFNLDELFATYLSGRCALTVKLDAVVHTLHFRTVNKLTVVYDMGLQFFEKLNGLLLTPFDFELYLEAKLNHSADLPAEYAYSSGIIL